MRVFKRADTKFVEIIEVWRESSCLKCPCGKRTSCNQCNGGYLPPLAKAPICWQPSAIKLSNQIVSSNYVGGYQYLAHGSYNLVYRSLDERWVLKIPINPNEITDSPDRAARVWDQVNPGFPAEVVRTLSGTPRAWLAPFIRGVLPTHQEIAQKILEIYERTGRIVADAFVTSNFVKTPDGRVVCIDIGAAFFLESRPQFKRSHSQVSLDTWNKVDDTRYLPMSVVYQNSFRQWQERYPIIIDVTKALLCLQMHRPDFRAVSSLLEQPELIKLLALHYDAPQENSAKMFADLDQCMALGVQAPAPAPAPALVRPGLPSDDDDYPVAEEVLAYKQSSNNVLLGNRGHGFFPVPPGMQGRVADASAVVAL